MSVTRISVALAAAAICAALAVPSVAGAGHTSRTGVTIHHRKQARFYGFAFSPTPGRCAKNRVVKLFRQTGKEKNPKRDIRMAKSFAFETQSGAFKWKVYKYRPGKFYARAGRIPGCQPDNSRTIHVSARPKTKVTHVNVHQRSRRVSFRYTAIGGAKPYNFRCQLDHQRRYRHCARHGTHYTHVSPGRHVFRVRAISSTGHKDPTPAKRVFRM
jgi:hypothetical protein